MAEKEQARSFSASLHDSGPPRLDSASDRPGSAVSSNDDLAPVNGIIVQYWTEAHLE
jgi:hypothetical protein